MDTNGYLSEFDLGKTSYSQIANGQIIENMEVILKEVEVGPVKIYNVKAQVNNTIEAPLLLGQSAIQKLGPIQLNGNKLIISNGRDLVSDQESMNLYYQAYQAAEAKNYNDAISISLKALDVSTNPQIRAKLYDNLAWAYNGIGEKTKAIEALNKALGEDIMAEQPAYNLGVYLYEDNNFEDALRALNNFVQRHQNTTNKEILSAAYAYKGNCHLELGQYRDAETAFKKSLSLSPSSQANLGLADTYLNSRRYEDACKYYEEALSYEPYRVSNIKRWHQYGFCLLNSGQKEKALEAFKNAILALSQNNEIFSLVFNNASDEDLKSTYAELAYFGMNAQLYVARLVNNPRETIQEYERAYSLPNIKDDFTPQDYLIWVMAYEYLSTMPNAKEKTESIYLNGLSQFPDNPDLLFGYSLVLDDYDPKGMEALLKILDQEFTYNPINFDYATVYNNIAWRLCLSGKNSEALPYAENAIRLEESHGYSWETIGEIYFNLGRFQDCINAMTKCIELDSDSKKSALEFRAKSYQALGNKKAANNDLELIRRL